MLTHGVVTLKFNPNKREIILQYRMHFLPLFLFTLFLFSTQNKKTYIEPQSMTKGNLPQQHRIFFSILTRLGLRLNIRPFCLRTGSSKEFIRDLLLPFPRDFEYHTPTPRESNLFNVILLLKNIFILPSLSN